jgi:hypothetical protein
MLLDASVAGRHRGRLNLMDLSTATAGRLFGGNAIVRVGVNRLPCLDARRRPISETKEAAKKAASGLPHQLLALRAGTGAALHCCVTTCGLGPFCKRLLRCSDVRATANDVARFATSLLAQLQGVRAG